MIYNLDKLDAGLAESTTVIVGVAIKQNNSLKPSWAFVETKNTVQILRNLVIIQ